MEIGFLLVVAVSAVWRDCCFDREWGTTPLVIEAVARGQERDEEDSLTMRHCRRRHDHARSTGRTFVVAPSSKVVVVCSLRSTFSRRCLKG
jgi:hypothetical protein